MSSDKKKLNGVWMLLHRMTINGKGDDYKTIIPFIEILTRNTGCEECNSHAKKYLESAKPNPAHSYMTEGYDGLFKWTVNFHNTVNNRLGKSQITYEDAKQLYLGNCVDCTVDDKPDKLDKTDPARDFINQHTKKKPIIFK
jgi:hypothetical protein